MCGCVLPGRLLPVYCCWWSPAPPRPAPPHRLAAPPPLTSTSSGQAGPAHTSRYIYYTPERHHHSAVLLSNYSMPLSCCLMWPILAVLDVSRERCVTAGVVAVVGRAAVPSPVSTCSKLPRPRQPPPASRQHSYLGSYHGGGGGGDTTLHLTRAAPNTQPSSPWYSCDGNLSLYMIYRSIVREKLPGLRITAQHLSASLSTKYVF